RLYAFFNNVPEKGIDGRKGAAKPFIDVPNPTVASQVADLHRRRDELQAKLNERASGSPETELASKDGAAVQAELTSLQEKIKKLEPRTVTQVQVMQELPERRPTYLLMRGVYDQPDKSSELLPALPNVFGSLPPDRLADRLALAEWLVSPNNPLTA